MIIILMKYKEIADLYSMLEKTSKRLEKTYLISKFIKSLNIKTREELEIYLLLIRGKIFPEWDSKELGISDNIVIKAISKCMGVSVDEVKSEWKKLGDLGLVAGHLVNFRKQSTLFSLDLSVKKVFNNFRKLAFSEGKGSVDLKIQLLSELLSSADPVSARFITRNVLEDLRIGVASSSLRDAIACAYLFKDVTYDSETNVLTKHVPVDVQHVLDSDLKEKGVAYSSQIIDIVQSALDKTNDFSKVAWIAKNEGIEGLKLVKINIGTPIKVMLAQKCVDFEDGFKTVGFPCQIEYKYDGFRMQVHKKGDMIKLFTRRLDEVTNQFPDVVDYVKSHVSGDNFILDSEVVGYDVKTKKYLPFQSISQRIRRKYDIVSVSEQFPVELVVFDVICFNNEELLNSSFESRQKIIQQIIDETPQKVVLARSLKITNPSLANQFFEESLAAGNEGIMLKKLDAPYKPGSRVGHMVKIKPVMESLDLVITGAEWGSGKRSGWLTSFTLSCYSPDSDEFLEIGKVGTGIKEIKDDLGSVTFTQLTELLSPYIIEEDGKNVVISPKLIIEIEYDEIQKSPTYSSGFALRFPRVKNIRYDRSPEDCSSTHFVEDLFYSQNKR